MQKSVTNAPQSPMLGTTRNAQTASGSATRKMRLNWKRRPRTTTSRKMSAATTTTPNDECGPNVLWYRSVSLRPYANA